MTTTRSPGAANGPAYGLELTRHLSDLVRLWSSPAFREWIVQPLGHDLTTTDNHVLWELAHRQPVRPGDLAAHIGIGAPGITKSIARLRARHLVDSRPDPHDRRARLIVLTALGSEVTSGLYRVGDDMIREVTASWSPEDLATLTRLVERFSESAQGFAEGLSDDERSAHRS